VRVLFSVLLLLVIRADLSHSQSAGRDTTVYRDTLIARLMPMEHKPVRFGASVSEGLNLFSSDVMPEPLGSRCDSFTSGKGWSPNVGLQLELPLWGDLSAWSFVPQLAFETFRGELTWDETAPRFTDTLHYLTERQQISTSIYAISIRPHVAWEPMRSLRVTLGPDLRYLVCKHFDKHAVKLADGDHFADFSRDSLEASGTLPNAYSFIGGLSGAIGYEFPLSNKLRAEPYFEVSLPLPKLTPYWQAVSLRGGLRLNFDISPRNEYVPVYVKERVPVLVHIPAEGPKPKQLLNSSISAVAYTKEGKESKVVTMAVEEVRSRNAFPVLNMIFFDEGSAAIPSRYVTYSSFDQANASFNGLAERKNAKVLDVYHETLNILGDRLRKSPKTLVTLTGSTSNTGVEADRIDLAQARAETIKKYLTNVWRIDAKRITTQGRLLPENPSPSRLVQGQQENARVEITVSDEHVSDPITVINTEHIATPDRIELLPYVEADSIESMTLKVSGGGRDLITWQGDASTFAQRKAWAPTEEVLKNLRDSLTLTMEGTDTAGNIFSSRGSIPLVMKRVVGEKQEKIERFSLILFGFDESRVGRRNERTIEQIAKALPALNAERIAIIGYTDEMGDAQHNNELSRRRAEEVRKELEALSVKMNLKLPFEILTEGRGSMDKLYDNTLPEGRFYSRTVNLVIERKVKE
jgi:outer membrane protein OmpA-like peptidoglycan-associated protein